MKFTKILSAILLMLLLTGNCLSLDTTSTKYYPLKVGNVWIYTWSYGYNETGLQKVQIVNTCMKYGNIFYVQVSQAIPNNLCFGSTIDTIRIDSTTGNFYKIYCCNGYYGPIVIDSLKANFSDTILLCYNVPFVCVDTFNVAKFGILSKSKRFYFQGFEQTVSRRYVKNFGIDTVYMLSVAPSCRKYLKGCVIDGIVYGDTTTVTSISPISTEIPKHFMLYQNYPNPFNPTTKIKFEIPQDSRLRGNDNVVLKVYDILGNEVSTLVNEQLKPGTYEVEFDGSNYSSGVYYYQLIAGDFVEMKKMILIK